MSLSRRKLSKLRTLQSDVRESAASRNLALRIFIASRFAMTGWAQKDLWLEFSCADQEYRSAVNGLAKFCRAIRRLDPDATTAPTNDC